MKGRKEAHPDTAMSERAKVETGPASQARPPLHHKHTTAPPPGQALHVADFLSRGEAHAVPLKYLKDLLHLNGRKIRLMIRKERLSGVAILENSRTGYYLPGNDHERARCVRSMRRRAAEIVRVADAIERGGR